ncbi:MAG: hypothetical protein JF606_00680 [Burkholderiales bacterium]|nr:hypothetical protein [Burkholderiales bacterium]
MERTGGRALQHQRQALPVLQSDGPPVAKKVQDAMDIAKLIPSILEVKAGTAKDQISKRQGMSSAFANAFNPNGTLKLASAADHARSIHKKLNAIRQARPEIVLAFEAATNMPRSNSSRASTSADPIQTLLSNCLMKASTEFAKARSSMTDIARAAGVSEDALRPFFTESGPTEQGWEWLARCGTASVQAAVKENVLIGHNNREAEKRSLKTVLNLLQSGHTFEQIGSLVEGVTVPDFFGPGSVTARGRAFLLSLDEDQRSTYTRVLNLPVDWASPAPQEALQHQRQALPVLESDSPPAAKQVKYATYIDKLIPLILEVKAGALPSSIAKRPGMSIIGNAFNRNGTLKPPSAGPHAQSVHHKLNAIRQSHRKLVEDFEAALKRPSSRLPPLEQAASDLRALIPLILEVKDGRATPWTIAKRPGMGRNLFNIFDASGNLKPGSGWNKSAQSIHNKLQAVRQTHPEVVLVFEAATNMPRTRNNSLASTSTDPVMTVLSGCLMRAYAEFAKADSSMADIAQAAGVSEEALRPFFTESGPTEQGWEWLARCSTSDEAILHTPWEVVLAFIAATNMSRTSNSSRASTSSDSIQALLSDCLMKASTEFAKALSSMTDIARAAGVSEEALRPFFTDSGPTEQGLALLGQWSTSIQAAVRQNVLSLDEDQRSTYTRVLNLPVDWASPASLAPAQSSLSIHIPGGEWSGWGSIPSTPGDEVMGPPGPLRPEASLSVTLPGPQWPGWSFDPGTPGEVMGPARPPPSQLHRITSSMIWDP